MRSLTYSRYLLNAGLLAEQQIMFLNLRSPEVANRILLLCNQKTSILVSRRWVLESGTYLMIEVWQGSVNRTNIWGEYEKQTKSSIAVQRMWRL